MAVLTFAPSWVIYFTCMWIFALSSEETKTVKPGDDVTLQCQSPRDANITLSEWSRPDLKKDGYVFFFRENRPYESFQHPSFSGRVQLRDPEMKDGDASVILKNVTINDTGTYECRVSVIGNGLELINTTYLKVEDSGHTAGNTWTEGHKDGGDKDEGKAGNPGLTVVLTVTAVFLLAVFVGFVIHRQHKQRRDQQVHYIAAVPQQV
ncbi:coxsackievirus and adenovirus receptor homolog isoform X1 [Thunnus thynnus]|uniref:coxsackievirus and adenovirus receptor homolog isoform X1 n=1 Tax=Thunnus thynnus TaxID=8237 RepID=UPI0035282F9F